MENDNVIANQVGDKCEIKGLSKKTELVVESLKLNC